MRQHFETYNNEYKTGDSCPKSGTWICKDHPAVEITLGEGKIFPRCYHVAGHNAIWWYLVPHSKN